MDPHVYQQLNDKLSSMSDKMASLVGSTSQLADILKEALKPLEELGRGAETLDTELKKIVNQSDDVKDRFKILLDLYKKNSVYQTKSAKDFESMKNTLEKMKKQAQDITKSGFMSSTTQRALSQYVGMLDREITDLTGTMKKLGKSSKDALDPTTAERYERGILNINRSMMDLLNNTKKLGQTQRAINNIREGLKATGTGFQLPIIGEKYKRYGQAAAYIREAKEARVAGNEEAFRRNRASALERMQTMGISSREAAGGMARQAGGGGGIAGLLDKFVGGRVKAAQEAGGTGGVAGGFVKAGGGSFVGGLGSKLGGLMEGGAAGGTGGVAGGFVKAGGGSFVGGLGSKLGGLMEGGAAGVGGLGSKLGGLMEGGAAGVGGLGSKLGGLMEGGAAGVGEAIGGAAIPLAILEMIRETFDKVQEQNKKYEAGLGAGGIISAGRGSFAGVREALTPTEAGAAKSIGAFSTERNLKIAQAMVESGLSVSDLAKGGEMKGGFTQGITGEFQRTAYGAGRVAGFSDVDTVKTTIKLLQQYRQSISASGDFFLNVDKAAKAAGMSTTKYVSLLDDITSGFGRLNKSFNESMNAMQLLGRTGANSSEDIKTYVESLTGVKQQLDLPTRAYLMTDMSPERKKEMMNEREFSVKLQKKAVEKALTTHGISTRGIEGLINPEQLDAWMSEHVLNKGLDPKVVQDISQPMKQLSKGLVKRKGMADWMSGKLSSVGYAQFTQATGSDMQDTIQTMGSALDKINEALRGSGELKESETFIQLARREPSIAYGSLLAHKMAEKLGVNDQQGLETYVGSIGEAGKSVAQAVGQGTLGDSAAAKVYDMVSEKLGLKKVTSEREKQIEIQKAQKEQPGKLSTALTDAIAEHTESLGNVMTMYSMLPSANEKTDAQKAAENIELNTRTTSDMLKNLVDAFFRRLVPAAEMTASGINMLVKFATDPLSAKKKEMAKWGEGSAIDISGGDVGRRVEEYLAYKDNKNFEEAYKKGILENTMSVESMLKNLRATKEGNGYAITGDKKDSMINILKTPGIEGVAGTLSKDKEGNQIFYINTTNVHGPATTSQQDPSAIPPNKSLRVRHTPAKPSVVSKP
jgi:hypothetical protein